MTVDEELSDEVRVNRGLDRKVEILKIIRSTVNNEIDNRKEE